MSHDVLARVVQCIANTTRYPSTLLSPQADLELDLGIDSVKRLEIVLAIEKEFGLQLQGTVASHTLRTIDDLAAWISTQTDATLLSHDTATPTIPVAPPPAILAVNRAGLSDAKVHELSPVHVAPVVPAPHWDQDIHRERAPRPRRHRGQLEDRIALVTGSGHGVGRVIARDLASRGATVVVNSFHSRDQGEATVAEIRAAGHQAIHLWGSIANPEHVDRMFEELEQTVGGLDILICNASDGRLGSFLELTFDDWDRAFRTNVAGHHQCALRAARLMQRRGSGAIVTLSAVGAHQFIDGLGSQGVAKAAVESMTRYLACELGPRGIRVNCVAGGPVYGELLEKFPTPSQSQRHWESITPDGQLCSPMDLANTIAYLVSDDARGINGAVWMVDHGFSANADGRPIRRLLRDAVQAAGTEAGSYDLVR